MFLAAISVAALILGIYLVVRTASAARWTVRLLERMSVPRPSPRMMPLVVFLVGAALFIFGALNLFPR